MDYLYKIFGADVYYRLFLTYVTKTNKKNIENYTYFDKEILIGESVKLIRPISKKKTQIF